VAVNDRLVMQPKKSKVKKEAMFLANIETGPFLNSFAMLIK
jgi:hypothetical protein